MAVYVGPGDEVHLPARVVAGGTPLTVLGWRLLAYQDTTLVVASASSGSAFVGAASPVDLDSYLAGVRVLDVRAVSPAGALSGGLGALGDEKAWERADTGLTLLSDLVATAEVRARGDKADFGAQNNEAGRSWSARFAAYPLWVLVERKPDIIQGRPNVESTYVTVLERADVAHDWKVAFGFLVDGTIPHVLPDSADATVTTAEAAKFGDTLKPWSAYLSGSTPDGPPRSKIMPAIKAGLDQVVIDQTSVRSSCDVWGGGSDPSGSIRAVRTSEEILGAAILRCTKTTTADPGREIYWNEPHVGDSHSHRRRGQRGGWQPLPRSAQPRDLVTA